MIDRLIMSFAVLLPDQKLVSQPLVVKTMTPVRYILRHFEVQE